MLLDKLLLKKPEFFHAVILYLIFWPYGSYPDKTIIPFVDINDYFIRDGSLNHPECLFLSYKNSHRNEKQKPNLNQ